MINETTILEKIPQVFHRRSSNVFLDTFNKILATILLFVLLTSNTNS